MYIDKAIISHISKQTASIKDHFQKFFSSVISVTVLVTPILPCFLCSESCVPLSVIVLSSVLEVSELVELSDVSDVLPLDSLSPTALEESKPYLVLSTSLLPVAVASPVVLAVPVLSVSTVLLFCYSSWVYFNSRSHSRSNCNTS